MTAPGEWWLGVDIGPRTAERLHCGGVATIGDVHRAGSAGLEPLVGASSAATTVDGMDTTR